ncbi:MAG: hypothetical protein UX13_C0034G0011 [Candidatus Woesebacteria bacterium GW2011_GWB1_45_5]|uniref:POTRA domain-containing protein n=1 Tax=Candidatus Woesebacteria bacterium GW2011_GWB1_45_5 TaxID=1618581 RepID=A0A0G1MNC1_9BACT|nr:MAG: hypothetical protein UX13_C0034G0011 [Candidatus Woesebacteria bacterium GW2011_GWB1_45_5]
MKKYLPFLLIFLTASVIFLPQFLIKVRLICKSQYGECPPDLAPKLQTLNDKNLIQAKKKTAKILKDDPLVLDYSMQFKFPDVLEVNLLIKKPSFAFQDKNTGKIYTVDEEGKVLSEKDDTSLPLVIQEGADVNLFALKIMAGVFAMYQVRTGEIAGKQSLAGFAGKSLVVELPGSIRVIFPLESADSDVMLGALRLVYARVQNDKENKYSEIDLRFKNPVLR